MRIERTLELEPAVIDSKIDSKVDSKIDSKVRVDAYIAAASGLSRSLVDGDGVEILIDGKPVKKSALVHDGDVITVSYIEDLFEDIVPQDIPLDVIYEDENMLVIDKPQGMVVHPAAGNHDGTLVNALAFRYGKGFVDSMTDGDDFTRPGIVHRLDKDTSGIMVVALNPQSHSALARQFASRTVSKTYSAICKGRFVRRAETIESCIGRDPRDRKRFAVVASGGRYACTKYQVVRQYDGYALCSISILTGRTHQIRVHMSHIGHGVLGDPIYGRPDRRFPEAALMLHARRLELDNPSTGERMKFESREPSRFESVLNALAAAL